MPPLPVEFYRDSDVCGISRSLLGKRLCSRLNSSPVTSGIIVETEAYAGPEDRASHAYGNRRTNRTEVMFRSGGVAYVYLCYGIHALFNVVTNVRGIPHAVLVRAIEPTDGIPTMLRRRKCNELARSLTAGPGALCEALGIKPRHSGTRLTGKQIWIEDTGLSIPDKQIISSPRVGVDYAGHHAHRPWRFRIRDSAWTSPAK
jgi:DNA-3-methyladenine glycosylase